jgi:gamma-glutamyl AIG2-like cyclotransferase
VPALMTDVFFYGLFMDTAVLEAKGVRSTQSRLAVVRGWALRIGQRATLVPAPDEAVHGVLMALPLADVERLYAEASVQMYRPVAVLVETAAGAVAGEATAVAGLAYVLPEPPAPAERNPEYATKLRALAQRLGLPGEYCRSIR